MKCREAEPATAARCCLSSTSSGLRNISRIKAHNGGISMMPITDKVHNQAGDRRVHPNSNSSVSAVGSRLRRRLSMSFHWDSFESGLT
jgi:hypothetical protein